MAMKLLLCKNVDKLGIVGDVVNVAPGYARNYLVPHGLATEPTEANVRRLAEARKIAERERAEELDRLASLAEALTDVEVTIRAKANEDGVLYGSVTQREIAAALEEEGHYVKPDAILLGSPIKHLDNVSVELRLADNIRSTIKVWVVRDKIEGEDDELDERAESMAHETAEAGTEAGNDGDGAES